MATKVIVNIPGEEAYDVRIGTGVLDALGARMRGVPSLEQAERVLVVTDENVAPLYRDRARESLAAAGFRVSDIVVPAGEDTKSVEVAGEIWEAMAQLSLGRDCAVVALGGGVVGDLAGFAASTYMRGVTVDCFQSNHEGVLIDRLHVARGVYDGIVYNPGAHTHYSYALRDAVSSIDVPTVEVHLSDISSREDFRKVSVIAPVCIAQIKGKGKEGYKEAVDVLLGR